MQKFWGFIKLKKPTAYVHSLAEEMTWLRDSSYPFRLSGTHTHTHTKIRGSKNQVIEFIFSFKPIVSGYFKATVVKKKMLRMG